MKEIDLSILDDLPKEIQKVISEEIVKLNKEVDDLGKEIKLIEKRTIHSMSGIPDEILDYVYGLDIGPFYATFILNQIALGVCGNVVQGCLILEFNFLFFTLGVEIPLGIEEGK